MRRLLFIISFALGLVFFVRPSHAQDINTAPLYLFTTGSGEITSLQNGQMLNVGQNYEMTALPDAGSIFSSWQPVNVFTFEQFTVDANGNPLPPIISMTDTPVPNYTYQPVLDFTMQPEMVLLNNPGVETITQSSGWQANFVPAPEPSTIALVVCGLVAIGLGRKMRR